LTYSKGTRLSPTPAAAVTGHRHSYLQKSGFFLSNFDVEIFAKKIVLYFVNIAVLFSALKAFVLVSRDGLGPMGGRP
jgi:hypothetical protein